MILFSRREEDHSEDNGSSQKSTLISKSTTTPFFTQNIQLCFEEEAMSFSMGAHTAIKAREQMNGQQNARSRFQEQPRTENNYTRNISENFSGSQIVNYSEKFMNSVWGKYNRLSTHNIKSNIIAYEKQ